MRAIRPVPVKRIKASAISLRSIVARRRAPPPKVRAPVPTRELDCLRAACQAGMRPTNEAVRNAAAALNNRRRRSSRTVSTSGVSLGSQRTASRINNGANARAAAVPRPASQTPSIKTWRRILPRLAPSATRVASSSRRFSPRTSSKVTTLAQAINSTQATAPSRIRIGFATGPTRTCRSGWG